jgi:hypothetical protein
MFDTVLIGVDGREGGRDAIALARRLAPPGAEVTFAHVYGMPTAAGRAGALALSIEQETAEQLLSREAREARLLVDTAAVYETSVGRGLHRLAEQREGVEGDATQWAAALSRNPRPVAARDG